MISLVTQSDGSARRLPLVSVAIAAAMAAVFFSYEGEMKHARVEAEGSMAEAVRYFEKYPYIALPDSMQPYLSAERAQQARAEYESQWEHIGVPRIPDRMRARVQNEFDQLVSVALTQLDALPVNVHAYRGTGDEPLRLVDHVLYHAMLPALLLSIAAVLLAGIPLEDVWGSIVFGLFCALVVPLGAVMFAALQAGATSAWIGGSGLAAALLGASAARWLGSGSPRLLGAIPLAPWWVLPAWAAAEYGAARGLDWREFGSAPYAVHAGLVAAGLFVGLVIRGLGLEEALGDRWDESKEPVRNPKLEQAMKLREQDKRDEALALLAKLFAKKPDPDVATALWDVSKEAETPAAGAKAAVWRVRDALRRKQPGIALDFWNELVSVLDTIPAEPPLFVKLAEMQLADDKTEDAMIALDRMLSCTRPISGSVATKAAGLAATSDPELASRVASVAIQAGGLSARERARLESIAAGPRTAVEDIASSASPSAEKRVPGGEALHVKTRVLPAFQGLREKPAEREAPAGPLPEPEAEPGLEPVPALDSSEAEAASPFDADFDDFEDFDDLDPNAFSPDALGSDDVVPALDAIGESTAADPSEIAKWNSPGLVEDLSEQLPDAESAVDASSLREAEPPRAAPGAGDEDGLTAGRGTVPILDDAPHYDRPKRILGAVPISLGEQGVEIDVEEKGKMQVPFQRIEALAVGAVRELGAKPVVLIDLVLNWSGDPSEPLKVLRVRSDRFDPRALVPGSESGVAALRAFAAAVLDGARPECLPDEASVRGEPFGVHHTLAEYEKATIG
jgi:membrane associated rhomboid family serine protease